VTDVYRADRCDLCASTESSLLPVHDYSRAMWSDSRLAERPLRKLVCGACGLVRDGHAFAADALAQHYGEAYRLNAEDDACEHQFLRDGRWIPRTAAIAQWMLEALAAAPAPVASIFEVGAGQGLLLRRFGDAFPGATLAGCEPNREAAARGRTHGLDLTVGDDRSITGRHDLVVASFVLEHVPSPTAFLQRLTAHLTPGGRIVVALPMQDVESHDVYFADHLHHFATSHVEWVGNRAGLRQRVCIKSPWFAPNASVHVFEADRVELAVRYVAPAAIASAVARWEPVFAACRALPPRRYALFGAGEFAGLLHCYGELDRQNLVAVFDDRPERYPSGAFGRRVVALDAATADELAAIDAVVLALNPVYAERVARRSAERGLAVVNPFAVAQHV
jgi:SAM-dependent methyltransferase